MSKYQKRHVSPSLGHESVGDRKTTKEITIAALKRRCKVTVTSVRVLRRREFVFLKHAQQKRRGEMYFVTIIKYNFTT